MINEGVRRAYLDPDNKLRASIVADPACKRADTRDNTPAVIHTEFVPGDDLEITVAAKGGGSENKSMFAMLNPSDSVADWVVEMVPEMGAGWCPPGMLGVGIGGSAEKAMLLAKKSLMDPIDIGELVGARPGHPARGAAPGNLPARQRARHRGAGTRRPHHGARREGARLSDARGLAPGGGDSQLRRHPPHSFHARWLRTRGARAAGSLGSGRRCSGPPDASARRVVARDADHGTRSRAGKPGERLLLSGKLLTGRDAAHKRICALLDAGKPLPDGLDFHQSRDLLRGSGRSGRRRDRGARRADHRESHGPLHRHHARQGRACWPWWARRSAGRRAIESIRRHGSAYLIAVGGAAFLVSQAIRCSRVVGFPELGMEAVYEFEVRDMPVTVAVSSEGESVHDTGPAAWRGKFAGIPVTVGEVTEAAVSGRRVSI